MYDILYLVFAAALIPPWLLLMFFPYHQITKKYVHSGVATIFFSICYFVLTIENSGRPEGGNFFSLKATIVLLSHPPSMLLSMIHYFAIDLLVGSMIVKHAKDRNIPRLAMLPVLVLTLAMAPIGVLAYFLVQFIFSKTGGKKVDFF